MTKGERAALNATNSDELTAANRMRDLEDLASDAQVGPFRLGDVMPASRAKSDQEEWLTKYIASKLGDPNISNLTRARRGELRREVSKVFKEHIDKNPHPIPAKNAVEEARGIADTVGPNAERLTNTYAEKLEKMGEGGSFDPVQFSSLRNSLTSDMNRAYKNGNYELGSALSNVQDTLDNALARVLSTESRGELRVAREQWGILKALERGSATQADGTVNARSLMNAYEMGNQGVKTGLRQSEFVTIMDTFKYLTSRQTGNSGTARRLANAGLAGAIGSGAYGLSGLLHD